MILADIPIKYALFDMDGTLTDTMPFWIGLPRRLFEGEGLTLSPAEEATLDTLGLVKGKIRCHSESDEECLTALCEYMKDAGFLTVFKGSDISTDVAESAVALLSEKLGGDVEVLLVDGGQPLYDFLISAE